MNWLLCPVETIPRKYDGNRPKIIVQEPLEEVRTVEVIIVTSAAREKEGRDIGICELKVPSNDASDARNRAGAVIRIWQPTEVPIPWVEKYFVLMSTPPGSH